MTISRFLITCSMALLVACGENYSPIPEISNLQVSPLEIEESDTVEVWFRYYDSNGDIGYEDTTQKAVKVIDNRNGEATFYHVPPIVSLGTGSVFADGPLSVITQPLEIIGSDTVQRFTLSVQVEDREGHKSNILTSDTITILVQ